MVDVLERLVLCRTSVSDGRGWPGLPGHLLDLILRHFERANYANSDADAFVKSLLQLRLVCKAWRDACPEFSGRASICTTEDSDLKQLCKRLPRLTELAITNHATDFSLSPLSALTRLSSLSLDQCRHEEEDETEVEDLPDPVLDLAHLPSSLKALELLDASVDPSCHRNLKCTGLTSLNYIWTNSMTPEAIDLLRHLPDLQVGHLCLGSFLSSEKSQPDLAVYPTEKERSCFLITGSDDLSAFCRIYMRASTCRMAMAR